MSSKGTVEEYLQNVPERYLVRDPRQIEQIGLGLTEYFGEAWRREFDASYVESTKADRLIRCDEDGNLLAHLRIFNKDFDGFKCLGLGGVFKTSKNVDTAYVIEIIHLLLDYRQPDLDVIFGISPRWVIKFYDKFITGVRETPYIHDKNFTVYYWVFPHVKENKIEELEARLGQFELF